MRQQVKEVLTKNQNKSSIWIIGWLSLFLMASIPMQAQFDDRLEILEENLEEFAKNNRTINDKIDVEISGSVQEVVAAIGNNTKLNVLIDPDIKQAVTSTFSNARAKDILLYLCDAYDLDLKITGDIIRVTGYEKKEAPTPGKKLDIEYNNFNRKLTLNLQQDTLEKVLREIVKQSNTNIIADNKVRNQLVNGYFQKMELENALNLLARANDLTFEKNDQGFYVFSKALPVDKNNPKPNNNGTNGNRNNRKNNNPNLSITVKKDSTQQLLDVKASQVPLVEIIEVASEKTGVEFFILGEPQLKTGKVAASANNRNNTNNSNQISLNLSLESITYEDLLSYLLKETDATYRLENGVYFIGSRTDEMLRGSRVVQIEHRPVDDILEAIPEILKEKVTVQQLTNLNAVLLSGSVPNMNEVELVLDAMDRSVPNVTIELIIMEVSRRRNTETGIKAGIGDPPPSSQTVFPGLDFTFSSSGINNFLDFLEGRGLVNIGRVQPNFFLQLKAIEDVGWGRIQSRPQLSTLNAEEAKFSIGETQYYAQEQSNISPGINNVITQTRRFEEITADFSITVTPVISGDEFVTMDILVSQSDFIPAAGNDLPPGTTTREFDSKIRVKDQEVIVLGGLHRKVREETGTGVPILSRIPVLKWFFSSKSKKKERTELIIFVKPTIIY